MKDVFTAIGAIIAAGVIIITAGFVLSIPTWFLWNALLPELFGFKSITVLQALGINVLCSILFKANVTTTKSN